MGQPCAPPGRAALSRAAAAGAPPGPAALSRAAEAGAAHGPALGRAAEAGVAEIGSELHRARRSMHPLAKRELLRHDGHDQRQKFAYRAGFVAPVKQLVLTNTYSPRSLHVTVRVRGA